MTRLLLCALAVTLLTTLGCSDDTDPVDGNNASADAGFPDDDTGAGDDDTGVAEDTGVEPDAGFEDTGPRDTGVIDPNETPFLTEIDNGDPNVRIDVVIVGDGYRIDQLDGLFEDHIERIDDMLGSRRRGADATQPFRYYRSLFNLHKVYVASAESGIDDPAGGDLKDTALDGSLVCENAETGPCHVDFTKVDQAIENALQGSGIVPDVRMVMLNTSEAVGATVTTPNGPLAIFSGGLGSGRGSYQTREIGMVQFARVFCGAGDERFDRDEAYLGDEPEAPNLTTNTTTVKWARWNGFNVNDDGISAVGLYEGGAGVPRGIYRPTEQSKLNNPNPTMTSLPYNAVVREACLMAIYERIPVVTDAPPEGVTLDNPQNIDLTLNSFELLDSLDGPTTAEPITIEWRVNNVVVPEAVDTRFGFFNIAEQLLNLPGGTHTVRVTVRDESPWVRVENAPGMTFTRQWQVIYRPN